MRSDIRHLGVVKNNRSEGGDVPKSVGTCRQPHVNNRGGTRQHNERETGTVRRIFNAVVGGMFGTRASSSGPV